MKTIEAREPLQVKYCDICGKKCNHSCPRCARDWCAECIHKGVGVVAYWNSPFAGYVVAVYCKPCDIKAYESPDALYLALREVNRLRDQGHAWTRDARIAESALNALLTAKKE